MAPIANKTENNFGVTNKEYYGMLLYFLEWSMVRFPDSKQYYNNRKNDMSLFPATN